MEMTPFRLHALLGMLLLILPAPVAPAAPTLSPSLAAPPLASRSLVQRTASAAPRTTSLSELPSVSSSLSASLLTPEAAGAMPFLSVNPSNHTLVLEPAALQALASLPAPLCVLSVAGAAHEGKSSLLNMFSHWVTRRWETTQGAGDDFKVASGLFDAGTDGAWLRVFTGKDGPLPGTECRSLALIDAQGSSSSLSLEGGGDGETGSNRLFALSTLASSTVALNIMSPVLNQLHQLSPMILHARRSLTQALQEFTIADLPSLVVVARDARLPAPAPPAASATARSNILSFGGGFGGGFGGSGLDYVVPPPLEQLQLEYAMLQPRGDALDATKSAVRSLFPLDRRVVEIGMPDARDLEALNVGQHPQPYIVPGLPLSGLRPFYASFDAAAAATVRMLRPKSLGGHALPGSVLADALVGLVDTVNRDAPPSLQKAVYGALDEQASAAVAAGVRGGIDSLKHALLPALSSLPGASGDAATSHSMVSRGEHAAGGEALTQASLEATLANATEHAYDEFIRAAPEFGGADGEPAAWLRPYAGALLSEMRAIEREAHKAIERARQFELEVEARVTARLDAAEAAERPPARAQLSSALSKRVRARRAAKGSAAGEDNAPPARRRRLFTSVALAALSVGAGACFPPSALAHVAPVAAALTGPLVTQLLSRGPTLLALVGIYRLAQRPASRLAASAMLSVQAAFTQAGETASVLGQALAHMPAMNWAIH